MMVNTSPNGSNSGQEAATFKGTHAKYTWVWVLSVLLGVGGVGGWLVWTMFADKTYTLEWPGGLQVQVEEENTNDLGNGFDDIDFPHYTYRCFYAGNEIGVHQDEVEPSPPVQGSSQGVPYFFLRKFIGIYHAKGPASSPWVTWDTDDKSLTEWLEKFEARCNTNKKHKRGDFFESSDYGISSFKVKGQTWIIGLHELNEANTPDYAWYGGTPKYLYVESRDRGLTWKVKERVSTPNTPSKLATKYK